jgi:hypothetical protein
MVGTCKTLVRYTSFSIVLIIIEPECKIFKPFSLPIWTSSVPVYEVDDDRLLISIVMCALALESRNHAGDGEVEDSDSNAWCS